MRVLFDIVVVLNGELLAGQVSPEVTGHVVRRLAKNGLIADDASVGELTAVVGDLVQRMRYALGEYLTLPGPSARETTHVLIVPTAEAARACREALADWGGSGVTVRESQRADGFEVTATFPELAPDPGHEARAARVQGLAGEHGGRYQGSGPAGPR